MDVEAEAVLRFEPRRGAADEPARAAHVGRHGAVDGRVDAVLSNPPFHEGVSYDYQTSERFIQVAKDKMTKHAALMIVANGFLKYASVIEHHFGRCDVLVETTKFKVYKTLR